jgi:hypothetical protein
MPKVQITIEVGEPILEFKSFQDWVDTAQHRFKVAKEVHCIHTMDHLICVDANGRVVTMGKGFMRARNEGTFPVKVFPICEWEVPSAKP